MTTETPINYTNSMRWLSSKPPLTTSAAELCTRIENADPTFEFLLNETRCLYLDVDHKLTDDETFNDGHCQTIVEKTIEYALAAVKEAFDFETENYAVATSHGTAHELDKETGKKILSTSQKYSVRLWFPEITGHAKNIEGFVKRLNKWILANEGLNDEHIYQYIPKLDDSFFDEAIYNNGRKMRCVNTSKPTEERPLTLIRGNIADTIIQDLTRSKITIQDFGELEAESTRVSVPVGSADSFNIEKYINYMNLIPSTEWDNYANWYKIQRASANIGIDFDTYDSFMKNCKGYNRDNNAKAYEKPGREMFALGWGFIYKCAEKANKQAKLLLDEKFDETSYACMKRRFERNHVKILNKAFFIKETENDTIILKKSELDIALEHLIFETKDKKGEKKQQPFIKKWFTDPTMRTKDDIDIIPHDKKCPENIYNLWKPFSASLMQLKNKRDDAVVFFRNHIRVLSGNNDVVAAFIERWLGQMLVYPSLKTFCLVFISSEGAGKGSFNKLLSRMLGAKKVFETSTPDRDVWGSFNSEMKNSFLVVLNELSKKQTCDAEGKIKALITDSMMTINEKGKGAYNIVSNHRVIITTNNEDPITTKKDDRRNLIIRSSDCLKGNAQYFEKFNNLLTDDDCIRSFYDYLISLKGLDTFHMEKIPETEYQTDLKEAYVSPVELWIRDYANAMKDENDEPLSSTLYESFCSWKTKSGIVFDCNAVKFALKLKNLNINGIVKNPDHNKRRFNFSRSQIREHFGIGPIQIETDDESDTE